MKLMLALNALCRHTLDMVGRRSIESFVTDLAEVVAPPHLRNPYEQPEAANNLQLFLTSRDSRDRILLFVGEAPGYRGAALSGVPLTSLSILLEEWDDPWTFFGPTRGYQEPGEPTHRRESTATIFWNSVAGLLDDEPVPLTWNAVPFHPFGSSIQSNAPLAKRDVELGRVWLERLIELFPNADPVAVGERACDALDAMNVEHWRVRHPSRGGKALFEHGVQLIKKLLQGRVVRDNLRCTRLGERPHAAYSSRAAVNREELD